MNRVVTGYDEAGNPAIIRQGAPPTVIHGWPVRHDGALGHGRDTPGRHHVGHVNPDLGA